MDIIEFPEELKHFDIDEKETYTQLTPDLVWFFKHLMQEYFRKDPNEDFNKKVKGFNSSPNRYFPLAKAINEWNGTEEWIQDHYLSNLGFPTPTSMEKGRSIKMLTVVFKFLDEILTAKNGRNGEFWLEELRKKNAITADEVTTSINDYNPNFNGARHINVAFKDNILSKNQNITPTEFYLAKHKGGCQWYGIVKDNGWDARRKDYDKIKGTVLKSFLSNSNTLVSVVVCGFGGSGKSTVLRRLAIDCLDSDLVVFWITNLSDFRKNIETIKSEITFKYLLIIEDWERLKTTFDYSFFSELSETNHVRIVIGDREILNKEYLEFFNQKNTFFLSPIDNTEILNKVLTINPQWEEMADKVLSKPEFYNSSIYLILFVIAKSYENTSNPPQFFDEGGITAQFKSIVRRDLQRIYETYPEMVKVLYYWSSMCSKPYRKMSVSWEALLKLADFYNGTNKISSELSSFNLNNPVCQILSYYISLEQFVVPALKNIHICNFHHDLLLEEGLSEPIQLNWYIDKNIIEEIMNALIQKGEFAVARSVYESFGDILFPDDFSPTQDKLLELCCGHSYFEVLIYVNEMVIDCYNNIGNSESYWRKQLILLLGDLHFFGRSREEDWCAGIIKDLVDKGCKAKCVCDLYHKSLKDKNYGSKYYNKYCKEILVSNNALYYLHTRGRFFSALYKFLMVCYYKLKFE
jgi:hypothetical protein